MSNHFGSLTWAAARPRTAVLSSRTLALLPTAAYRSLDCGAGWSGGLEKRVEQHAFATFAAVQANPQVKDTGIGMPLGPPPWRPPEPTL